MRLHALEACDSAFNFRPNPHPVLLPVGTEPGSRKTVGEPGMFVPTM
jgi:hypothetical protein